MNWKTAHPQTRLYLSGAILLLVGLGSALLIYLTAGTAADSVPGYEPEQTKAYIHDLELYGGKANVLASELMHWFVGLWQGQSLAFTVACITIVISFGIFFVARHLPADSNSGDRDENHDSNLK
jgi:hypothetical protein